MLIQKMNSLAYMHLFITRKLLVSVCEVN